MTCIGNEKDFIDVLAAFGPVIIGGAVVYFAKKQWKTSEKHRRQGYLDHYISVYKSIEDGLNEVNQAGHVNRKAQTYFWFARDKAKLLLDKETANYVETISTKAKKAYKLHISAQKAPVGEKKNTLLDEEEILTDFLYDLEPHKKFKKFINID